MARNQKKPSESSSKKASLKVNVKGSGKVKKQSKTITKVTKTKATIKCSKCSKVISGKNSKVKLCAPCLKNIANLAKKNSAPPSKPKPLQNSKIKAPNKKTNVRASTSSNKNNPVATNILLNSKRVKSPPKTHESQKKTGNKRKSNDGEISEKNKIQTPKNIKSNKKVSPQSDLSLGVKMGLRGKKRSYVQLASGVSDDENKTKKLKTSKAAIPKVRGTRNKKPTPKASEWRSTISPKRKSSQKEKRKVETKRKSPKVTPTSKTLSNSNKSSPSKGNSDFKKSTTSSATKKPVKRLSNTKGDTKQSSPLTKKKVKTTPTTKTSTPAKKTTTPTTKTTTPTRSSTRGSAKFTSATVQKKTRNSSVKPLSKVVKKDNIVKSSNANLKDGVICAKEILEDILIFVANDSEVSQFTDTNNSKKDINSHIDSTETLENNLAGCVDNSNEKELQFKKVTCEEGYDAGATDAIELHLSPEKDIELHLSPEKDIELHLSPEKDIELHLSPETAESEMDIVETEMHINDYQDKEKVCRAITETRESVDSLKCSSSVGLEVDSSKVDSKFNKSPEDHKPQVFFTKICISDDHNRTQDFSSADDKPNDKLETKENGQSKNISHHSSENIGQTTNVCSLNDKNEMPAVASPSSVKVSQNSTHINADISNSCDSTQHVKPQDKNFQSAVVLASEEKHNCNELLQQQKLESHSENKDICNQALNKQSSEEILNSTEKKAPCAENNLSSNGHAENGYCKANSIESANKFSQSQNLANISPVHGTTYLKTLKSSSTDLLNEQSKALHIQDTLNKKGNVHGQTTKDEEQINAEVKLDTSLNSCSKQEKITANNDNLHIENMDDCKTDGEVSVLIIDSNNPNTGNCEESLSEVGIYECKVINNELLIAQQFSVNENERKEESLVKYDKPKTEKDIIMSDNIAEKGGEDSMSRDNVALPIIDGEDYINENGGVPEKYSTAYKTDKLVSNSFGDSKKQTDDVLLTNDNDNSEVCKYKSDDVLPTKDPNQHKTNSDDLLPREEFENCSNTTYQKKSESDASKNEVNEHKIVNVEPLIIDSNHKSYSLSEPVKHDAQKTVDEKVSSLTGYSEQADNTEEEPSCHIGPQIEESKTTESGERELFNRFETNLGEDKTKEDEKLPHQKEPPPIAEHKAAQSDQREIFPSKNELETDEGKAEKELSCQQEQSSQKEEYKTAQCKQSGIFDNAIETKPGKEKAEKEPLSYQKEESIQVEVYRTTQSNQSGILPSKIEIKTDEHKTEEGPICQKEQLPKIKDHKIAQSYDRETLSTNIEIKLGEAKIEEDPQLCQKAQPHQIVEEYKTAQSDQRRISTSQIEIKTDKENTSSLPLDSEVPVPRMGSPMTVDSKTDFENNENCDELTLKVEETREDCISIDGTDVESMQCNSETRSSNRMSVDDEVITMDIDQDDTAVDGSECQNFGIKVSNELNMEVN